jgi:hypothetical protein
MRTNLSGYFTPYCEALKIGVVSSTRSLGGTCAGAVNKKNRQQKTAAMSRFIATSGVTFRERVKG